MSLFSIMTPAMDNEILISAQDLSRSYGEQRAIDNISFNVHRGDILGFLGPNGAGKSTTMQIISGVLAAHHGTVTVAGYDIQSSPREAKKHIGFLSEQPPLYNDLTVDEYLSYAAKLRGIKSERLQQAMQVSKQRCGLEDVGARLIQNLSKGYKQRVGIAQAIIHSPAVIILDEPTAGLDPLQIREIRNLMHELASDHSVILSTHILSEVQTICNRVLIINQGHIVLDQMLEQLQDNKHQATNIEISLRNPPTIDTLLGIDGVISVKNLNQTDWLIHFSPDLAVTDVILAKAVNEQWGLYQLKPADASLESIFMRLTNEH